MAMQRKVCLKYSISIGSSLFIYPAEAPSTIASNELFNSEEVLRCLIRKNQKWRIWESVIRKTWEQDKQFL